MDTPSHFYSYSFEINPDWPRYYSNGAVLMEYWRSIAEKYRLRDRISFRTTVEKCVWQEADAKWLIALSCGGERREVLADAVIAASGLFTHPKAPDIAGLDSFGGVVAHTAEWDPATDVAGKRVVQIGTGASGVQVAPEIAPVVDHLTVFQRTPPWIMIRAGRDTKTPLPAGFIWALRHIPHLGSWMRLFTYWNAADGTHKLVVADPLWEGNDYAINEHSERMRQAMTAMLEQKLAGRPDLLDKMLPDYPVFGKRLLQDASWCETLMRDNVDLVTSGVERVVEDGVVDGDGRHHPADVLVLATGFAMTRMMQNMEIVGRAGVRLRDVWGDEDPRAYLGTLIPGFPNFFLINGPNAGATHGAGVNIYSEAQIHYVLSLLEMIQADSHVTVEASPEAFEAYNDRLEEALKQTVWNHPRVQTYYKNSKGRNFVSCPWRIVDMWHMFRQPRTEDLLFA